MEKKQFQILIENYTCLSAEEADSLLLLEKEFPYCQVIRSLSARASQDNNLPEREDQLHLAAMCVTDRAVFKSVMTAPIQPRKQYVSKEENVSTITEQIETSRNKNEVLTANAENADSETLFETVMHDMEELHNSMHAFEEAVKKIETGIQEQEPGLEIEAEKELDLISEIKVTKKKIKPEGPRQKEQIEIIDQFIKTQPTIKGRVPGESSTNQDDLAGKNDGYNENIISETLAQILIKQGKKDKAIDILKKLIWKFPQKKAYFAAQIEELKK